jgi:putative ABC transport system permease protein
MFGDKYIDFIVYKLKNEQFALQVKKGIFHVLAQKYRFDPEDDEALQVFDTIEFEQFFRYFFLGFEIFLGIVGSFTLIVGAINLSNIMSFIVEDRRKEIGIKMALGATATYVKTQFLVETFFLILVGGILGFLFSAAAISIFPSFKVEEYVGNPVLSIPISLITIGILGASGIWAGYPPARKAAELSPVEAIKD